MMPLQPPPPPNAFIGSAPMMQGGPGAMGYPTHPQQPIIWGPGTPYPPLPPYQPLSLPPPPPQATPVQDHMLLPPTTSGADGDSEGKG
eukprot:35717-Eustigmatos_ZCMA.PRE.1